MFFVAIDQHDMYIVETDGVEMEPYLIDQLTVAVAQRYSIIVTAKNDTTTNYAMSIMQSPDMYDNVPDTLVLNNTLQIIYATNNTPATSPDYDPVDPLDETKFVPVLVRSSAPADISYRLDVFFDTYDDGTNRASFNNITFQEPVTPTMFTALTMGNDSFRSDVYGAQTNAFAYPHGAMIELVVYNWDAGFHPFHLHG